MRVPPTRSNGLTDANVVPQFLVSRVEVVTGGASAAYGSDAVAGVINYIMNNRFEGIKGTIQGGVSQRGDDVSYRGGLAVGKSLLDDRLHIVASAEYSKQEGIDSLCGRPRLPRACNRRHQGRGPGCPERCHSHPRFGGQPLHRL